MGCGRTVRRLCGSKRRRRDDGLLRPNASCVLYYNTAWQGGPFCAAQQRRARPRCIPPARGGRRSAWPHRAGRFAPRLRSGCTPGASSPASATETYRRFSTRNRPAVASPFRGASRLPRNPHGRAAFLPPGPLTISWRPGKRAFALPFPGPIPSTNRPPVGCAPSCRRWITTGKTSLSPGPHGARGRFPLPSLHPPAGGAWPGLSGGRTGGQRKIVPLFARFWRENTNRTTFLARKLTRAGLTDHHSRVPHIPAAVMCTLVRHLCGNGPRGRIRSTQVSSRRL